MSSIGTNELATDIDEFIHQVYPERLLATNLSGSLSMGTETIIIEQHDGPDLEVTIKEVY